MNDAIVVQRPPTSSTASELLLLFHGVGSTAQNLLPLAQALAAQRPSAWVISVRSSDASDFGAGWQWFSVKGITEESRPQRVADAMPAFLRTVAAWQNEVKLGPEATTLIGFSQGAIMALAATQQATVPASRVVAIAGRFAASPTVAPANTVIHLLHGEEDAVMPVSLSIDSHARLQALDATSTLDRSTGLGHGIDARVVDCIQSRLASAPSASLS